MQCRGEQNVKAWLVLYVRFRGSRRIRSAVDKEAFHFGRFIDCRLTGLTEQSMHINVQLQCALSSGKAGAFNISFV